MKKLAKIVCIAVCALNGMAVCSFGVFAQQSEKIKVVEPYASVSFGTGRAEVAQTNLPLVDFGLGNRYSSISTKTGLSLEADYAIDWGMLRETGDNSCFSTSFKLSVGIGYNYIFNTEDVFFDAFSFGGNWRRVWGILLQNSFKWKHQSFIL